MIIKYSYGTQYRCIRHYLTCETRSIWIIPHLYRGLIGQTKSSKSQVPKMKIMQLLQTNLATAGITLDLLIQPYPLNAKILMGFSILCISIICLSEPFFNEEKTSFDYVESNCAGSYVIFIISILLFLILKVKQLFGLISDCECIANSSEYKISKLLFYCSVTFAFF